MRSSSQNAWSEEGQGMAAQQPGIYAPYHQGNAAFGTGMFQNSMENSRPMYEPWKTSIPSPASLQQWPGCYKDRDDDDGTTDYTTTQKSSAGSSCGDEDWNSTVRSNLAGEYIPGDPFGFQDAEKSGGLIDLDPEVGRQRGQELLAMLMEAPLSKASSVREPPGLRQSLGPRPGSELLSTAVPSQSQTFSQPWIPLGTAFAQGNRTSHPNGFAL
mmetsp:Transcript_63690/g.139606  ORF Transcript_63690/g.139606 Transcript_63690/m.139606 type:complete len:214 (-) Transcript_63690:75-716(-)